MTPTWSEQLTTAWCNVLEIGSPPRTILQFVRTLKVWARDQQTGQDRWEPFDPESHPAQREILLAFLHGGFDELTVLGPVQDGKTFACVIACLLYCLIELKQSAGLMLPDEDKAEEVWLEKVKPVIEASGYGWILPTEGRGARGGGARFLRLNTGATVYLIGAGASNESAQSSFTCRFMFVDEASKIRAKFISLAWGRTASYDQHARKNRTSTISDDHNDSTVLAYDDSTRSRNYFRCPLCVETNHPSGGWQVFDFDPLPNSAGKVIAYARLYYDPDTDDTARATARLVCAHDATHLLTDEQRRTALRDHRHVSLGQTLTSTGQVTGAIMGSSRKGIRWCSLESPIKTLGQLAKNHRQAIVSRDTKGNHEQLRQFTRDECVRVYHGDTERTAVEITATGLSELSGKSNYEPRQVPPWVDLLTVGQDVQENRHYWLVSGHGPEGRRCVVDWGYELCVPLDSNGNSMRAVTEADHHHVLGIIESICAEGWQIQGSEARMSPQIGGIDVNYIPGSLLPWIVGHPQWLPCIGVGGERAKGMARTSMREGKSVLPVEVAQSLRGIMDIRQVQDSIAQIAFITRSQVQQTAHAGMLSAPGEPGSLILPRGQKANSMLCLHLSSRVWTRDEKTNSWYWREVRRRDDLLACLVIGDALARFWRVYQPWLAANAGTPPETPTKPSPKPITPTTPDGRPLLLSDR
jgi:hypothetical protein